MYKLRDFICVKYPSVLIPVNNTMKKQKRIQHLRFIKIIIHLNKWKKNKNIYIYNKKTQNVWIVFKILRALAPELTYIYTRLRPKVLSMYD